MVLIGSGCQASLSYTKLSQTKKFLIEVYNVLCTGRMYCMEGVWMYVCVGVACFVCVCAVL